jgi:hypothetical protein
MRFLIGVRLRLDFECARGHNLGVSDLFVSLKKRAESGVHAKLDYGRVPHS